MKRKKTTKAKDVEFFQTYIESALIDHVDGLQNLNVFAHVCIIIIET